MEGIADLKYIYILSSKNLFFWVKGNNVFIIVSLWFLVSELPIMVAYNNNYTVFVTSNFRSKIFLYSFVDGFRHLRLWGYICTTWLDISPALTWVSSSFCFYLPIPANILLLFALQMKLLLLMIPRLFHPTTLKTLSSLIRSIHFSIKSNLSMKDDVIWSWWVFSAPGIGSLRYKALFFWMKTHQYKEYNLTLHVQWNVGWPSLKNFYWNHNIHMNLLLLSHLKYAACHTNFQYMIYYFPQNNEYSNWICCTPSQVMNFLQVPGW